MSSLSPSNSREMSSEDSEKSSNVSELNERQ